MAKYKFHTNTIHYLMIDIDVSNCVVQHLGFGLCKERSEDRCHCTHWVDARSVAYYRDLWKTRTKCERNETLW